MASRTRRGRRRPSRPAAGHGGGTPPASSGATEDPVEPGVPPGPGAAAYRAHGAHEAPRAPGGRWRSCGDVLRAVLRGTVREFKENEFTDRAAALTYYGVLSLFPALLVLVSLLSLAGASTTTHVVDNLERLAPGSARDSIDDAVHHLQANAGTGSVLAVVGLLGALWTASGYVAAFIRTANTVYGMPEGRPVWRVLLVRLGVTVALMVLACASALIVVFTGGLARRAGSALGMGHTALTAWSIAKWPVLVLLVIVMITVLYRATPNVKAHGARWITAGSCLALLIWMAASAGFALYVANFASYNRTYGTLAGVIVFLVWLWISNLAILLGLAFNAELGRQRERATAGGGPAPPDGPIGEPRDTRAWSDEDRRRAE